MKRFVLAATLAVAFGLGSAGTADAQYRRSGVVYSNSYPAYSYAAPTYYTAPGYPAGASGVYAVPMVYTNGAAPVVYDRAFYTPASAPVIDVPTVYGSSVFPGANYGNPHYVGGTAHTGYTGVTPSGVYYGGYRR